MKTSLFVLFLSIASFGFSQITFNTGSKELDSDLSTINVNAKGDLGGFKVELSKEFDVSTKDIDGLFSLGMEPGEVYLSLEISKITGNSVEKVGDSYKTNKGKGWGVIAKEMGIKPGSSEFHQLKGNSKAKKDKGNSKSKGNKGNNGNKSGGNGNSKNKKK